MKKLHRYTVMFENWASPIFINAYTVQNAIKRAEQLFPVCDCGCGEKTVIKQVGQLR